MSHKPSYDDFYQIIRINGIIMIQKTQLALKTGMKIIKNEQLLFKTQDASMIVSDNSLGRFVIKSPAQATNKGETVAFARDLVLPLNTNTSLSTRGTPSHVRDFKEYFGESDFYIVGDQLAFEVDHTKFKASPNQFFQIRYQLNDSTVTNKWASPENKLVLDKNQLFVDKKGKVSSPNKFEVFWVVRNPRSVEKLATFRPIFLDENALKAEYQVLFDLSTNQNLSEEAYQKHFFGYFRDVYGRTDENTLENWLEGNFKK